MFEMRQNRYHGVAWGLQEVRETLGERAANVAAAPRLAQSQKRFGCRARERSIALAKLECERSRDCLLRPGCAFTRRRRRRRRRGGFCDRRRALPRSFG